MSKMMTASGTAIHGNLRRAQARRWIMLTAAATILVGASSAADARRVYQPPGRATGYDGYWNVLIITDVGTCDRTYSFPVQITGGRVMSGGAADVAGSVARSGAVVVRVASGGSYASGSGRLGAGFGSGRWSGRGSAGFCGGRWQARRG
jgi:hypothetical protein